jgi:hypothetical protein
MRRGVVLAALLLPLGGCYAPPSGPPSYAQPGYPPPSPGYGYAQPPPGYQPGSYDESGNVYPGYNENGGDPTLLVGGAVVPLIVFGGGWGYWDSRHNWHRAPDAVSRHLEERREAGGFRHGGDDFSRPGPDDRGRPDGGFRHGEEGFAHPRPDGRSPPAAAPNGGQTFFHANPGAAPAAPPSGGQTFFHATPGAAPAAPPSGGQTFFHATPSAAPAAPPNGGQSFFHANPGAVPAPAARPAPPPPHEEHGRGHECPPGQRC